MRQSGKVTIVASPQYFYCHVSLSQKGVVAVQVNVKGRCIWLDF